MVAPGPAHPRLSWRRGLVARVSGRNRPSGRGGPAPGVSSGSCSPRPRSGSRGRQRTRPTRPTTPTTESAMPSFSGTGPGVVQRHGVRGRHHDHEVRGDPPRALGPARPPSSGSTRSAPRPGRRCGTRGTTPCRRWCGCRSPRPRGAGAAAPTLASYAGTRAQLGGPARGDRPVERGSGRSTSPTPRHSQGPSSGSSCPVTGGRPKHSDWVPACGVVDHGLERQRRDGRGALHRVDVPAERRRLVAVRHLRDELEVRVRVGMGLRLASSTPCSSGRRGAAGSGRRGRSRRSSGSRARAPGSTRCPAPRAARPP